MPRRRSSITSMAGFQLWTNISENAWWNKLKADPNVEETLESRPGTPPDSEDCSSIGAAAIMKLL